MIDTNRLAHFLARCREEDISPETGVLLLELNAAPQYFSGFSEVLRNLGLKPRIAGLSLRGWLRAYRPYDNLCALPEYALTNPGKDVCERLLEPYP